MKGLLVLGSTRESSPPSPRRLGHRVALYTESFFSKHWDGASLELIDPLSFDFPAKFKPHFSFEPDVATPEMKSLASSIEGADFYVMLSPEYNHSMSPALANLLNHFGSSLFSFKPSLIITYSAGQWGGVRAAIVMRSFLSELGCLPVSAMLHIPKAEQVFDSEGRLQPGQDADRWEEYFGRGLSQVRWWAEAAGTHRQAIDPTQISKPFLKDPSQRNSP